MKYELRNAGCEWIFIRGWARAGFCGDARCVSFGDLWMTAIRKPRMVSLKDYPYAANVLESGEDDDGRKLQRVAYVDCWDLTAKECRRISAWLLKAADWIEAK